MYTLIYIYGYIYIGLIHWTDVLEYVYTLD